MSATPLLYDEKVRLRAMEPEDLELIYRIENMTDFWRQGAANVPYSRYAIRKFITESQNNLFVDGQVRFMVERQDTGATVGCVDLIAFNPLHHRAEVGILILPDQQHRGFARHALTVLCHYAHRFLQLRQLYAYVAEANSPATRLFASCSFEPACTLSDWLIDEYGPHAAILFQRIFP